MITAQQGAKLDACNRLMEAMRQIAGCTSLICMDANHRKALDAAMASIDGVLTDMAPSNKAPKKEERHEYRR